MIQRGAKVKSIDGDTGRCLAVWGACALVSWYRPGGDKSKSLVATYRLKKIG